MVKQLEGLHDRVLAHVADVDQDPVLVHRPDDALAERAQGAARRLTEDRLVLAVGEHRQRRRVGGHAAVDQMGQRDVRHPAAGRAPRPARRSGFGRARDESPPRCSGGSRFGAPPTPDRGPPRFGPPPAVARAAVRRPRPPPDRGARAARRNRRRARRRSRRTAGRASSRPRGRRRGAAWRGPLATCPHSWRSSAAAPRSGRRARGAWRRTPGAAGRGSRTRA